jgi:hypothetical protein
VPGCSALGERRSCKRAEERHGVGQRAAERTTAGRRGWRLAVRGMHHGGLRFRTATARRHRSERASVRAGSPVVNVNPGARRCAAGARVCHNAEVTEGTTAARRSVVLLSGGLDSAVAAACVRADGDELHALSFDYGQRHRSELDAASHVAAALDVRTHPSTSCSATGSAHPARRALSGLSSRRSRR